MTEQEMEQLTTLFKNNFAEIPLFYVTFNLEKCLTQGKKDSCDLRLHPSLRDDAFIVNQLHTLVDHIRQNYDMDTIAK